MSSQYLVDKQIRIDITDSTLVQCRFSRERQVETNQLKLIKPIQHLLKWESHPDLKLEIDQVHNFTEWWSLKINEVLEERERQTPPLNMRFLQEYKFSLALKLISQKRYIERFLNARHKPVRDETVHRLHTSITGLKGIMRNFLTFQGQELVSIDIKASQPYLFNRLLQADFWSGKKGARTRIGDLLPHTPTHPIPQPLTSAPLMSLGSSKNQASKGFSATSYSNIDWKSDFYGHLMNLVQSEYSSNQKVKMAYRDRLHTKKSTMLMFFNRDPNRGLNDYQRPFLDFFPKQVEIMRSLHIEYQLSSDKRIDTLLPVLLQRLESKLVLEKITQMIAAINPGIFLLTVHDSIITTSQDAMLVYDSMNQVLTKELGIVPGLKMENLSINNAKAQLQSIIERDTRSILGKKNKTLLSNGIDVDAMLRIAKEPMIKQIPSIEGLGSIYSTRYLDKNEPLFYPDLDDF